MTFSDRTDRILDWLKWPAAIVGVVLLPGLLRSLYLLVRTILASPQPMAAFFLGLFVYLLLWWTVLRRPVFGSYLATLEHELTHALFAALTGHRVIGLKATWRKGGRVRFVGRGNWLITLAPYFFPTACMVVLLAGLLVPAAYRFWVDAVLGAALGYHVVSTWRETHLGQSDLKKAGYVFSLMFLLPANLFVLGVILSFAHGGAREAAEFVRTIAQLG